MAIYVGSSGQDDRKRRAAGFALADAPMQDASSPRRRRLLCLALLALAAWPGWEVWHLFGGGNVHAVVPGAIYRGAQHSPAALAALVQRLGIRTVVNLRGCGAPEPWYLGEVRVARDAGISHEDLTFSATRLPSKYELQRLVELLDRAEPPLFFHCRQGADRTGIACATALLLRDDVPYATARQQLGLRYGHVPFGQTARLDAVFDLYEAWLAARGEMHSPSAFRLWVAAGYGGGWLQSRIESVERLGAARAGKPLGYRVRIRNVGTASWRIRPSRAAGLHLGCRLSDERGFDVFEGRGGMIEADLAPGEVYEATLVIPPTTAGRYRLLLDLVEEGHCWSYQVGSEPWEEELLVDG
jgi:protein tyrosine phosphatase (PTP) superfamily phosphohydrolase (DUF442 family)